MPDSLERQQFEKWWNDHDDPPMEWNEDADAPANYQLLDMWESWCASAKINRAAAFREALREYQDRTFGPTQATTLAEWLESRAVEEEQRGGKG